MFISLAKANSKAAFSQLPIRRRLASTLAFLETTEEGQVAASALSTLRACQQIGNPITALLVGAKATEAAENLKRFECGGLEKILTAPHAVYHHYLPEALTPLCTGLLKDSEFTHFIAAASAVAKNLVPRLGALLDVQPVSDIVAIKDERTFVRSIYAGNALITVEDTQNLKLISVRSSAFSVLDAGSNNASISEVAAGESVKLNISWEGANLISSERPELGSASKVISGGRGLKDKENFEKLLYPLADVLEAGIGATRAAVDSGFCDNSLQIGQTGKVIAPDLYIAVGVSGAIQHLAGMKNSKVIVAVNKDPDAPIFQTADYGLVGDVNDIIPELTEKLRA